jgi:hypothetical protein
VVVGWVKEVVVVDQMKEVVGGQLWPVMLCSKEEPITELDCSVTKQD